MQGPRGTKKPEYDEVLKLVNDVFIGSSGPLNTEEWYPLLFNYDNLENMRIIIADGKPVSHIGISQSDITVCGCKTRIGSIGSVCTYPQYRGRGFATKLLEDCMLKLDEDGADIMLVSGGRGLYRRAGCVAAGRAYNFSISQDDLDKFDDQKIALAPYEDEDLANIVATYQKEPVRFCRSLEDFKAVLSTGAAMDRKSAILTIRKDSFLGYLVIQVPQEAKKGQRIGRVAEYAGVRRGIVGAVKQVFDRYAIQELNLTVPFHDTELLYALEESGIESTPGNIPGTIRIINFPRLMRRFRPYLEERLGKANAETIQFDQEDDKFAICSAHGRFNSDGKSFAQVVFGSDGREKEMIPEGEMSEVLIDIFPLPFPWPGLNYV